MTHEDLQTRLRRELDATEPPLRLDLVSLNRVARARRRRRRAAAAAVGVAASVTLAAALVLGLDGRSGEAEDLVASDPNAAVTPGDPTGPDRPVLSPDDPRVVDLGSGTGVGDRGSRTVQLGPRPPEASAVIVSVTCLTAGTVRYAEAHTLSCSATTTASSNVLIHLEPGQESIRVTADEDVEWELSARYARVGPGQP